MRRPGPTLESHAPPPPPIGSSPHLLPRSRDCARHERLRHPSSVPPGGLPGRRGATHRGDRAGRDPPRYGRAVLEGSGRIFILTAAEPGPVSDFYVAAPPGRYRVM